MTESETINSSGKFSLRSIRQPFSHIRLLDQKFLLQPQLLPSGGFQVEWRFKALPHWLNFSELVTIFWFYAGFESNSQKLSFYINIRERFLRFFCQIFHFNAVEVISVVLVIVNTELLLVR